MIIIKFKQFCKKKILYYQFMTWTASILESIVLSMLSIIFSIIFELPMKAVCSISMRSSPHSKISSRFSISKSFTPSISSPNSSRLKSKVYWTPPIGAGAAWRGLDAGSWWLEPERLLLWAPWLITPLLICYLFEGLPADFSEVFSNSPDYNDVLLWRGLRLLSVTSTASWSSYCWDVPGAFSGDWFSFDIAACGAGETLCCWSWFWAPSDLLSMSKKPCLFLLGPPFLNSVLCLTVWFKFLLA